MFFVPSLKYKRQIVSNQKEKKGKKKTKKKSSVFSKRNSTVRKNWEKREK